MTAVLVRLKVDLLKAGLRASGPMGKVGFAGAIVIAVLIGGSIGFGLIFLRAAPLHYRDDAVLVAATVLLGSWVLFPLMLAAADGTLEVDRLTPFPLTRRQLMPGLLAASLVGTGGLTSVLVLAGLGLGVAPASPLAVVTVVALAVLLAQCSVMSRIMTTVLSGAAKKRRWRDIAMFVAPMLAVSINLFFQILSRRARTMDGPPPWLDDVARLASWLPSGPAARAIAAAAEGRAVAAAAWLAAALAVLVVGLAVWGRATAWVMTSASTAGTGRRRRVRTSTVTPLYGRLLGLLPRTRVGVVAAKELRLQWRDPRQRAALAMPFLSMLAPAVGSGLLSGSASPRALLTTSVPALMIASTLVNAYGFDGSAHWTNVAAGDDARADLRGKLLAHAVSAAVVSAVAAVGLAVVIGRIGAVPSCLLLAAGAFGIAAGIGLPFAVRFPVPVADSQSNVFAAGNAGGGAAQAWPGLATMFGSMALSAPFAVAALLLFDRPIALLVTGLLAAAVGTSVAWFGLESAVRASEGSQPELLDKLGRRAAT